MRPPEFSLRALYLAQASCHPTEASCRAARRSARACWTTCSASSRSFHIRYWGCWSVATPFRAWSIVTQETV